MSRGRGDQSTGTIRGNNRDNLLRDTTGDDQMDGRGGDDRLIHTGGNDTMTGGDGADVFVLGPTGGTVTVTDFTDGIDRLDISAFGFDQSGASATYWGNLETWGADTHVVFYDQGGEVLRVILEDFHHTQIDISDYIL